MPLMLAEPGKEYIIKRIGGNVEMRKHLEDMGFIAGETVYVVSMIGGNIIVKVKESRVAVSKEMAAKIMI